MVISDAEGDTVDDLIAAANEAPSFGINARELLLQAANASYATFLPSEPTVADVSQRASSGPLIGADELWAAVPISERPTVAFILRNPKVPRVLRQTVLNRLLVRELGSAAASSGEKGLRAVALLAVSQERRAVCVKAAVAAETDLYKRSNNKSVYLNLATRLPPATSNSSPPKGGEVPPAGVPITPNDTHLLKRGREEDEDTAIPHKPAAAAGGHSEDLDTRQQNGAALTGKKARSAKIAEADIDWDATHSCPVASQGPNSSGGDALTSVSAAGAALVSESASAPAHPAAADSEEHVANNEQRNVKATVTKGDWADEAHEAVTRGVRAFVMAVLDPLYAASVIDGKIYREVARKAVDKVMSHHEQAADIEFLLTEGDRIHKLVQQYCQRLKQA